MEKEKGVAGLGFTQEGAAPPGGLSRFTLPSSLFFYGAS